MSDSCKDTQKVQPSCRFYVVGKCQRGAKCAFSHSAAHVELPAAYESFRSTLTQQEIRDIQAIDAIIKRGRRS